MTNHDLKKYVEQISQKYDIDLSGIADKIDRNRSHISTLINNKKIIPVSKKLENAFKKFYPDIFEAAAPQKENEYLNQAVFNLTESNKRLTELLFKLMQQNEELKAQLQQKKASQGA